MGVLFRLKIFVTDTPIAYIDKQEATINDIKQNEENAGLDFDNRLTCVATFRVVLTVEQSVAVISVHIALTVSVWVQIIHNIIQ